MPSDDVQGVNDDSTSNETPVPGNVAHKHPKKKRVNLRQLKPPSDDYTGGIESIFDRHLMEGDAQSRTLMLT